MVKIRLRRMGARKRPYYRIVAIDSRSAPGGRALEFLGTYDPTGNPERVTLESERIAYWRSKGAQLTPTVRSLIRRAKRRQPAPAEGA
jgi:small subunit ribosomal protein S16